MNTIHTEPILHQASVLDEAQHVVEVTIIKPGPSALTINNAPVTYTEEALRDSLPLWDGAACFCDHWDKSVRNITGVFFTPWYDEGVKARLRFIDDTLYAMVTRIIADRDEGLPVPDIGISADIAVAGADLPDAFEVTQISQVISADIVFSPAAGGSFDRVLNSVLAEAGIADRGNHDQPPPAPDCLSGRPEATPDASDGEPDKSVGEPLVPEKRVRDLQSTADRLRNQVRDQEAQIAQVQGQLSEAVSRYRDQVLAANPEVPAELVSGDTVEQVDASLEQARALVDNVKQHLADRVPAGAPARRGIDTSSMSPGDKITYGLKQRGT